MNIVSLHSFVTFRPGKDVSNVKICKKCKLYLPNDERCKLFGNINVVTGNVEYNFASFERSYQGQCGTEGKYWTDSTKTADYMTMMDNLEMKEDPYNSY